MNIRTYLIRKTIQANIRIYLLVGLGIPQLHNYMTEYQDFIKQTNPNLGLINSPAVSIHPTKVKQALFCMTETGL